MKIDKCMIIPKIHIPMAMLSDNGMNNGFRYVLKSIKAIENVLNIRKGTRIIPFSSQTGAGRDEVWALMEEMAKEAEIYE